MYIFIGTILNFHQGCKTYFAPRTGTKTILNFPSEMVGVKSLCFAVPPVPAVPTFCGLDFYKSHIVNFIISDKMWKLLIVILAVAIMSSAMVDSRPHAAAFGIHRWLKNRMYERCHNRCSKSMRSCYRARKHNCTREYGTCGKSCAKYKRSGWRGTFRTSQKTNMNDDYKWWIILGVINNNCRYN